MILEHLLMLWRDGTCISLALSDRCYFIGEILRNTETWTITELLWVYSDRVRSLGWIIIVIESIYFKTNSIVRKSITIRINLQNQENGRYKDSIADLFSIKKNILRWLDQHFQSQSIIIFVDIAIWMFYHLFFLYWWKEKCCINANKRLVLSFKSIYFKVCILIWHV